jgi:hypothetical protein
MLNQLLVCGAVTVCNITIHALVMTLIVRVGQATGKKHTTQPSLRLACVMIITVLVLMAAHISEVMVWALAYWLVDAAPVGSKLVYFAFVNYTTLGYGDVLPVPDWQLLGPMTAMNGILLFGWSTAVIFEAMRRAMAK